MKTTISPFLFELNGLITVLLPQDKSFLFLMDLLRFNFQDKKMVNLKFWLGHCFDYCTTKINVLTFSILREIEINFFHFYHSVVLLYMEASKECHAIKFSNVRYSKSSCRYSKILLFSLSIHIFCNKNFFARTFIHIVCF